MDDDEGVKLGRVKRKKGHVRRRLCGTASREWKAGLEVQHPVPVEARPPIQRNCIVFPSVRIVGNDDLCSPTLSSPSAPRSACRRSSSLAARRGSVPQPALIVAAAAPPP